MAAIKFLLSLLGILAFLMGLVWAGQGSGYFPYPASSMMIDQSQWIWRGAILACAGVVVFLVARRLR